MKKKYVFILFLFSIVIFATVNIFSNKKQNINPVTEDITLDLSSSSIMENENTSDLTTKQPESNDISKQRMLEDFDYMISILEENSPFLGVMERKNMKELWERLKVQYRSDIEEKDYNIYFFMNKLNSFLSVFDFEIGHLRVMNDRSYEIYYHAFNIEQGMDGYHDAWYKALTYEPTTKLYKLPSKNIENLSYNESINIPFETSIIEENRTALLKIDSFAYLPQEKHQQELFEFYKLISNYENLIIDITKNGGGNELYWIEYIVSPNLQNTVLVNNYALYRNTTFINDYYTETFQIDKSEVKSLFIHENAKDYEILDIAIKFQNCYEPVFDEPLFQGKIWVLTSGTNFSAADSFVRFCRESKFATVVGKRTHGAGSGGNSLFFPLINSGILIKFDAIYILNNDGTCNIEIGTEPDYHVEGDPLTACLEIIKEEIINK